MLEHLHKKQGNGRCLLNFKVGMKRKLQYTFLSHCDLYPSELLKKRHFWVGLDFVELIGSLWLVDQKPFLFS